MEKIKTDKRNNVIYIPLQGFENGDTESMTNIDKILVGKVNELIDEIDELKTQLSRVHKDRPDPRFTNPYNLSHRRNF